MKNLDSATPITRSRNPLAMSPATFQKWRRTKNFLMSLAAAACVLIVLIPLGDILWTVLANGAGVVNFGFITSSIEPSCTLRLYPHDCPLGLGGIGPAIEGTLICLGIASLIAIPIGVGAAIYLSEYGRGRLSQMISFFMDVMSGIPSIVVGVFVFAALLDFDPNIGTGIFSMYAGSTALAIIMLPVVTRTAEESMKVVPSALREGAWALGIPHGKAARRIVLPSAIGQLLTGSLLAVARAGGETAPLLLTMGFSENWLNCSSGIFTQNCLGGQAVALGPLIFDFGVYPQGSSWVAEAWGAALVLILMMLGLSLTARILLARREARLGGA